MGLPQSKRGKLIDKLAALEDETGEIEDIIEAVLEGNYNRSSLPAITGWRHYIVAVDDTTCPKCGGTGKRGFVDEEGDTTEYDCNCKIDGTRRKP